MAERKYTHGLSISVRNGVTVVDIGDMEIWDGADLSLIRDTLHVIIVKEGRRSVGVDMRFVQHIPSGFFGMLFDWFEKGVEVSLFHPRERVRNMLWFRKFFTRDERGLYRLYNGMGVNEETKEELWTGPEPATAKKVFMTIAG